MCGRYVSPGQSDLERHFALRPGTALERTFNAAPTMLLPVVRLVDGQLVAEPMQWGLVPSWWSKDELPRHTINTRLEDAAEKPMWRAALRTGRCLVPALGWYEWKREGERKRPHFIRAPDGELVCFAGLWSPWRDLLTFSIATSAAAKGIVDVHDRMPLVLEPAAWQTWLDPTLTHGERAAELALASAQQTFSFYPVSTYVNSPRNQGEECIAPVQ